MVDWLIGVIAALFVLVYWEPITQFARFVWVGLLFFWLALMFLFFALCLFVIERLSRGSK